MYTYVEETFKDGTILITGSTGFLGKLLQEKLLRSCPLKTVAVLVRNKNGLTAAQRARDSYKNPLFDRLRKENPDFINHIKVIEGNIEDFPETLSSEDREWIKENVNFVFHCAATVRFHEAINVATKINIQGTENLLALAHEIKNLKGIVHVSTVYSHCNRDEIKEEFYPTPLTHNELKIMDKSSINILEDWPNTYTFTKALTENMIATNENHLPISIFRPSIIGCTKSEPVSSWLENSNGPPGVIVLMIIGLIRTFILDIHKTCDIIPADYTVNALICVMWDTVKRYQDNEKKKLIKKPKIFNYVSSAESRFIWGEFLDMIYNNYLEAPSLQTRWYFVFFPSTNLWIIYILRFFLHRIPAALIDLFLIICGKSSKMLNLYAKMENRIDMFQMFMTKEWKFDNTNVRELWSMLSQKDRELFFFSFKGFDWKSYIKTYINGMKKHLLNEDEINIKKALTKNQRLFWLHYSCVFLIICLVCQVFFICIKYFM